MDKLKTGTLIEEMRERQGFTRKRLADTLGAQEAEVAAWEEGLAAPDIDQMQRLAALFGVTLDELAAGALKNEKKHIGTHEDELPRTQTIMDWGDSERRFYKVKWLKDHKATLIWQAVLLAALFVLSLFLPGTWTAAGYGVVAVLGIYLFMVNNNRMMIYVESKMK